MAGWFGRVKQFREALTATVTKQDRAFIAAWLTDPEQKLFYQMNRADQAHSLRVAYTAIRLAAEQPAKQLNTTLLTRAALLHDVGRFGRDITIFDKVWTVLANAVLNEQGAHWAARQERLPEGRWRRALFLYYRHGEVGARRLAHLGEDEMLVSLVRRHHEPPQPTDSSELVFLRRADQLN